MSIKPEVAREIADQVDSAQLLEIVRIALQQFLNAMAAEGFLLPLEISLHDQDGDILRAFRVERGGKITLQHSTDALACYVWPLTAVAMDAGGRIAIAKIAAQTTEGAVSLESADTDFLN